MTGNQREARFVLCIKNDDCDDLEKRKVYRVLPGKAGSKQGYLRIVDESGEDYLDPSSYFVPVKVSLKARKALQLSG